jgi:hypothetical protein
MAKRTRVLIADPQNATAAAAENARGAEYFVEQITVSWNKQIETILATGNLLLAAKAELEHGKFLKMIGSELPFKARTAQMLMNIAKHPVLSNAKYISHLPPSWGTLSDLAAFPDSELIELIGNGSINPDMQRSDIKNFHLYSYDQVGKAIRVLLNFVQRMPPQDIVANWSVDYQWTDGQMHLLGKLPSYVTELHEAIQEKQAGDEAALANIMRKDARSLN